MNKSENRIVYWLKKNPIAGFITITFFISYVIGIPFNMFTSGILGNGGEVSSHVLPRIITVYAPGLTAIIMTVTLSGRDGLSSLLRKLRPEIKHVLWWFIIPVIFSFITFYSYFLGGQSSEHILDVLDKDWQVLFIHFFGQLLTVGVGEELGWRAWLLPRLLEKGNVAFAVISMIIIWGLWHFPILFNGYKVVLPWIILLISLGFILTWLWYKAKGNIFVLAIAHASVNSPIDFMENRLLSIRADHEPLFTGWSVLSLAYLLIAFTIMISNPKFLSEYIRKESTDKNLPNL
ncbi:type II CAAX endopeptidase family protein [Pedobacter sp. P351]|uniref:CPBP family intramembrane glutamic endopeptidase n=1 Tax=Pedobacter superstes TaxID=3133441 RepID=UPI0030B1E45A